MPTITCTAPACTKPGLTFDLGPTCTTSDPNVVLTYFINGTQSSTLTCPKENVTVVVTVKPTNTKYPACPYDAKTAYTVTGGGGKCPPRPPITCFNPPKCPRPGVVVPLAGSCSSTDGVELQYIVNNRVVTEVTCPDADKSIAVSVEPRYPNNTACTYAAWFAFCLSSELQRVSERAAAAGAAPPRLRGLSLRRGSAAEDWPLHD
jgi:hypothetical protein